MGVTINRKRVTLFQLPTSHLRLRTMIFIVLMLLSVRNSWGAHIGVHPWCTCCPLLGTEIYCQDGFLVTRLVPSAPSSSVFLHMVPLFLGPLHGAGACHWAVTHVMWWLIPLSKGPRGQKVAAAGVWRPRPETDTALPLPYFTGQRSDEAFPDPRGGCPDSTSP